MSELSSRSCLIIVLAAGEGKRMASALPKVLHPVAGLPMVLHVLNSALEAGATARAVVVGNQAEHVAEIVGMHDAKATIHVQHKREGTAHAVLAARDAVHDGLDDVVILYGDVPLIRPQTITAARERLAQGADIVVLGFETSDPTGYGRMLTDGEDLLAIREHKDATDEEKLVTFCNSGIMAFKAKHLLGILDAVGNTNSQGEYYLTDAAEIGRSKGLKVVAAKVSEVETLGVNDRVQLAQIETLWQNRKREELMHAGVTMTAPQTVILHHDTKIERDVTLEPNLVFGPKVAVQSGATIRAFSHLEGADVGTNAIVGPYARLRPGTDLADGVKIGNFVEIKAARIGKAAKVNHLSYIGDSEVGAGANIGAGSITCNYDGFNKHRTIIGEGAFIGTNTSLIAPVTIGKFANTAAGSAIYLDVPDDDLAVERSKQMNLTGKAKFLRDKYAAAKADKSK